MNLDHDFIGLKASKRARTGKEGQRFLKAPPMPMPKVMPMLRGMATAQTMFMLQDMLMRQDMLMVQDMPNKDLEQSLP